MAVAAKTTDSTPSTASVYIAPPATGSASVSFSSWRAVPEVDTNECQPETAPQDIVTNNNGHIGPSWGWKAVTKAGIWKAVYWVPVKDAIAMPTIEPMMPRNTNQKLT